MSSPYVVTVGGEHALTARVLDNTVEYDWQGEWATWRDLHDHPLVIDLQSKCKELIAKASAGKKGGAKGGNKGGAKSGQRPGE